MKAGWFRDSLKSVSRLILKMRAPSFNFLDWLAREDKQYQATRNIGKQLEGFLSVRLNSPEQEPCFAFLRAIPSVLGGCNDPDTYQQPFAPEAYTALHFLPRYWRIWEVLQALTRVFVLPLGVRGFRILDIGCGPAPTILCTAGLLRLPARIWATRLRYPPMREASPVRNVPAAAAKESQSTLGVAPVSTCRADVENDRRTGGDWHGSLNRTCVVST